MIYLTRRVEFSAAHTLYNPRLSPDENEKLFGKCGNPKGHGHNYVLEITVKGTIDSTTGFFINVDRLKETIRTEVVDVLDHRFINVEIDYFKENVPTCENMAMWVWSRLEKKLENCSLHRVKLYETRNNYVEYYGDASEEIR